jgi:hypothetical protein
MQFFIDLALTLIYFGAFLLVCAWSWRFWKLYINQKWLNKYNDDAVMLEIKLPRDIYKSPLAMEIALSSLLQGGGISNWHARNFKGGLPTYSSLEIASLEGIIHFYIRLDKKFRPLIESNLYAQYPGIEIVEADDYTKLLRYHRFNKKVSMWGLTNKLSKTWKPINPENGKKYSKSGKDEPKDDKDEYEMKADYLPMKTYVDYGLDKDPKEEFKVDPLTPLLEFMGGVGKGEFVWYQVLVQDESVYNKKFPKFFVNEVSGDRFTLAEMATARKNQIRKLKKIKKGDLAYDQQGNPVQKTVRGKDGTTELQPVTYGEDREVSLREAELTVEEKDEIEAINKKLAKPLACVIIRLLYLGDANRNEKAWNGAHIQHVLSVFKPFNGFNTFAPSPTDPTDFPWQNIGGKPVAWRTEEKFEDFVERAGFFPHIPARNIPEKAIDTQFDLYFWKSPMKTKKTVRMIYEILFHPFRHIEPNEVSVLNMEELATIWHFPGATANMPTLPRIDSTKGVAPVNLPQ